jgi:hypothetical protein
MTTSGQPIPNPYRPGAGHPPPFLAGRDDEIQEWERLLLQTTILENLVLTGLRGVGKTVLLDTIYHLLAGERGWIWVGSDLSESASVTEEALSTRICADLAVVTAPHVVARSVRPALGFTEKEIETEHRLDFATLQQVYAATPGLATDKLKEVLRIAWGTLDGAAEDARRPSGIVFAYDEAQNLGDRSAQDQYPLSVLLDTFQSLQRSGLPLMLVLTGLPTLFPKLVEARTYAERMFRVLFLRGLPPEECVQAIRRPLTDSGSSVQFDDQDVDAIIQLSGGYPYFVQFICKEVHDAFQQQLRMGHEPTIPVAAIEKKLDTDFFAGRWSRATDRQRDLLWVIAQLPSCDDEFTVQEIVEASHTHLAKAFSSSHVSQMLVTLAEQGLVFRNRHGHYSFAIPMIGGFIRRQPQPSQARQLDPGG